MSADPFSAPAAGVKVTEFKGKLLLITPTAYEEEISTSFGDKDAVRADIVVLDHEGGPEEFADVLIFQGVLISQTKAKIGRGMVLGRLGQRPASKAGQNDAWALEDPTDADKDVARKYLAEKDPFAS